VKRNKKNENKALRPPKLSYHRFYIDTSVVSVTINSFENIKYHFAPSGEESAGALM